MDNILIIGQQRTGSNLLSYALSFFENYRNINEFYSVDDFNFVYELFFTEEERTHLFEVYNTKNWQVLLQRIHQKPIEALRILDSFVKENKVIKLLDHQFRKNAELYSLFETFDKFIITERSNTLEQYVSLQIADKTNIWWDKNTDDFKVELDIEEYKSFCESKKRYYEDIKLKLKGKNYIVVNYENDLSNGITDTLLTNLQLFLHKTPKVVVKDKNRIKKQNTVDVISKITNFDQIKKYL